MNSTAWIGGLDESLAGGPPQPIVLLDGIPEPRLIVSRWQADGPCDRRQAVLRFDATTEGTRVECWTRQAVTVALPVRLCDGQCRWIVLLAGHIQQTAATASASRDAHELLVMDDWSAQLDQPMATFFWQTGTETDARMVAQTSTAARLGGSVRRSEQTWQIGPDDVFVFQDGGGDWTIGAVLRSLSAMADLHLITTLIPRGSAETPLSRDIALDRPVGEILNRLLLDHGLVVVRQWDAQPAGCPGATERRSVQPRARGRRITLPGGSTNGELAALLRGRTRRPAAVSRRWEVRGENQLIESTFVLVPGWDPALAGKPDANYSREASPDFTTYANVYRFWALNEDGWFTSDPYLRGPAFDVGAFFGTGPLPRSTLRLLPCLTLDDRGERRSPVVEMSLDGATNWSLYPGTVSVATDRAAVRLEDATLPAAFLAAAKVGQARVRVTASLQSPQPTIVQRWQGNPFTALAPDARFDLSSAMRFRKVAAGSIHFAAVRCGALRADEHDDATVLARWLVNRMEQGRLDGAVQDQPATLTLAGAWLGLQPGDRLSMGGAEATIRRIAVVWPVDVTQRGAGTPACTTEIELET